MNKKIFVELGVQEKTYTPDLPDFRASVYYRIEPDTEKFRYEVRGYGKSVLEAAENAMIRYNEIDPNEEQ